VSFRQGDKLGEALLASGLFDATWYSTRYCDVELTGMPPIQHFLSVGMLLGRDPGPDFSEDFMRAVAPHLRATAKSALQLHLEGGELEVPQDRVMLGAKALADLGRSEDAMRLARRYLGGAAERPLKLFSANGALDRGDFQGWLSYLNDYLAPYDILPIRLQTGETLLDRLCTNPVPQEGGGSLVSVIMPVFQAETTIKAAANSILNQSWANLELLIVDDASIDGTWAILQEIAASDSRVRIRRNQRNVGPYVSKNLALRDANGVFVTGHDADDWAHPQRIENHMAKILESSGAIKAGTNMMLRVSPSGDLDNVIPASSHHSPDGFRRRAFVSCLFEREALERCLGYYDCVRFGGDGEMLSRSRKVLGTEYRDFDLFAMICLDAPSSLTNHPEYGLKTPTGVSEFRKIYDAGYQKWHSDTALHDLYLPFPASQRPFPTIAKVLVPHADVEAVLGD